MYLLNRPCSCCLFVTDTVGAYVPVTAWSIFGQLRLQHSVYSLTDWLTVVIVIIFEDDDDWLAVCLLLAVVVHSVQDNFDVLSTTSITSQRGADFFAIDAFIEAVAVRTAWRAHWQR